jgi:hypothetical protein
VLGILLFSYFASLSLAAGVMIPITLGLWLFGVFDFDFDTFNAISGGINQFSSFLVVPVWAIAYTLLYFDSRVRNEGYDVDLLVRRLPQPAPRPAYATGTGQMPPVPIKQHADKFTPDGRCRRCGRVNMFNTASCAGCGW